MVKLYPMLSRIAIKQTGGVGAASAEEIWGSRCGKRLIRS
jgi:hypothetical protein